MISKIELCNWMPFKGTHIIALTKPFVHIVGQYQRNEKESNGSGKSSILQAIYFCLFGKTQTSLIHGDETVMYVKLYLDDGTIIQKGTDGAWINGEKTTNALINAYSERILNMTDKMFLYTHCILNGEIKGLFELSPKEQKQFLMDISTYKQDWEGLYDKSKWILSEVNKKIASYITRIEFIDEKLELVNISDAHDTLLQSQTELIAKEQELASFNAQEQDIFAQIVALKSGIETCKNTIHLINTTKEQQQAYHAKKKELTEQSDKLTADLKNYKSITAISNDLKLANENIMSVTVKLSGITKQLQKYKVSNGKCPILDTECPQVTLLKEKASEWTTEQEVLTISLSAFTKSKDMIQTAHDAVFSINQQLHSISQSFFMLGDAPEPPEDVNIYLTKQSDLEQQLIKLEGAFDSDFKERLLQSITQLQQRIPILESTIKSYNDYSNEKEMYDAKVSSVESKKKIVSVATKLLSPHGLPYYLSLKLLTTLEQYTNEFLKFMDTSVYITPYKVLNSMEDTCIIDGYKFKANDEVCPVCNNKREKKIESQITIYSGDRGIPLDGESTGRKAIFFTALRFGLMKLLNTQGKILIVDEVFANLDDTNKQKLLDMINHASKELNIEQIFIVSNDELKDILPVTVSVTRLADKSIIA